MIKVWVKNAIQKDSIEKTNSGREQIIAGIIVELLCFPLWVFYIDFIYLHGAGLAYGYLVFFSIPVASGFGLILYGIIKNLKQKNILSIKSIKRLKLISNLVVYTGLALLALSYALQGLYSFHVINLGMWYLPLPVISLFLICLVYGITSDRKNEKNEKEKIEHLIP
jgi:hypothetical protein